MTEPTRALPWELALGLAIFRDVWFGVSLVGWVVGMSLFWKHKDVYPFKNRSLFLMTVIFVLSFVSMVNAFVLNLAFAEDCVRYVAVKCLPRNVFNYIYNVMTPVLAFCWAYRGVSLLIRTEIQRILKHVLAYRKTRKLPDGFNTVSALVESRWLKCRRGLEPKIVKKLTLGFSIAWCIVANIFMFTIGIFNTSTVTNGVVLLNMMLCIACAWKLRHAVGDNFGITAELGKLGWMALMTLVANQILDTVFPKVSREAEFGNFFQCFIWTSVLLVSLVRSLRMVEGPLFFHATKVTDHDFSGGSTDLQEQGLSMMMSTNRRSMVRSKMQVQDVLPKNMSFNAIIDSQEGFFSFHFFLQTEFAAEVLCYIKDAKRVQFQLNKLIHRVEQTKLAIDVRSASGHSTTAFQILTSSNRVSRSDQKSHMNDNNTLSPNMVSPQQLVQELVSASYPGSGHQPVHQVIHVPFCAQITELYSTFLQPGSVQEISISTETRTRTATALQELDEQLAELEVRSLYNAKTDVFVFHQETEYEYLCFLRSILEDPLQEATTMLKSTSYLRFKKTDLYKVLAAQVAEHNKSLEKQGTSSRGSRAVSNAPSVH